MPPRNGFGSGSRRELRIGEGMGPAEAGARGEGTRPSRPRPGQAVAVAETAGGAGSGGGVTRAPPIRHRCLEAGAPANPSMDAFRGPGTKTVQRRRGRDVPGVFVTDRRRISWHHLSHGPVTEVRFRPEPVPSFPRTAHVSPGTRLGRPRGPRALPSPPWNQPARRTQLGPMTSSTVDLQHNGGEDPLR